MINKNLNKLFCLEVCNWGWRQEVPVLSRSKFVTAMPITSRLKEGKHVTSRGSSFQVKVYRGVIVSICSFLFFFYQHFFIFFHT